MSNWETGKARNQGENTWVIEPDNGGLDAKFNPNKYPGLNITEGMALRFTRNPNDPSWAQMIVPDTGLKSLSSTAQNGAAFTHAARTRLETVLAERVFWAAFMAEDDQADAAEKLHSRLEALRGPVKKQRLIEEGL